MKKRSDPSDHEENRETFRERLIGLGEASIRKSYYPELQKRLDELERFRALLDQSNDSIFLLEVPSGRIVDVNKSACRELDRSREDLLDLKLFDIIGSSASEQIQKIFSNGQAGVKDLKVITTTLGSVRGYEIPAEITFSTVSFDGTVYAVAVARNITERKLAEEQLRESEERYRHLFEESPAGNFVSTPNGKLLACNSAFIRIFGFTSIEEAMNRDLLSIYPDPQTRQTFLASLRKERKLEHYEMELRSQEDKPVHVMANVIGVFDEGGELVEIRGYLVDNTQRKKLEEQFRQSQKMEAVGRLAAGVAHDFNNLLTAIMGYSELMIVKLREDDSLRKHAEQIRKAGERASSLTRQLLAFSRKQVLQPKLVDLNAVVAEMEKMLRRLISEDIELIFIPDPNLNPVMADPGQIEQVLLNLAVNARDAMPRGGKLTIETKNVCLDQAYALRHVGVKPGPYVMLAVSDTGIGMEEKILSHVFEPFFTTKEKNKGTGLGLSTVYGIIRQSDGHIWVYSEPGMGTTFKIYLPQMKEIADEVGTDTPRNQVKGGYETILLVEDEDIVRGLAYEALRTQGYTVFEANCGKAALDICKQRKGPIHLIVTDVVMPGMNGRELVERLVKLCPNVKTLYISGYPDSSIVRHGVLIPGTAFLQKPFTPDDLVRKVREVLDERE